MRRTHALLVGSTLLLIACEERASVPIEVAEPRSSSEVVESVEARKTEVKEELEEKRRAAQNAAPDLGQSSGKNE